MTRSTHALAVLLALAVSTSACVKVYPGSEAAPADEPQAEQAGAEGAEAQEAEEESPFDPYDEVLKNTRAIDGYFKLHLKRDNTLFLEIRPDQLDHDFGLVMHYSRGVGDFNVHDGLRLQGDARMMRFTRVGDRLALIHRNPRFTADPGSPMRTSLEDNVGHSVVATFDIESQHEETENLVIDVTELFVSDYSGISDGLELYYGNKPVSFDKGRSWVDSVQAFPRNVEVDALLTYRASDFPQFGGPGVSDYRSIPVGIRYSLFALPEDPMRPRLADDRVGHFLTAIRDFSRDQEETPYRRYVQRWRLEKTDPTAEMSEPVEPIVFWIDRSVPDEYRPWVKEGIEAWNRAYEAAGFENAIVAKVAPTPEEDPTWSAEDIRYSTVRWTAAHNMSYAIGPSQADPRTGEILNADILISSTFVTGWLYDWQDLAGPSTLVERFEQAQRLHASLPPEMAERVCFAELGKTHQLGVQYALLVADGVIAPGAPMPEEYLGYAIKDLIMHEVGHTLTLRHNFKSSAGVPNDRLHDPSFTSEHGVSVSVMDYNPVNIAADRDRQGHYWNRTVGTYDRWAIRYAYAPIYEGPNGPTPEVTGQPITDLDREYTGLQRIAEQAAHPRHVYGTDYDNWLGPLAVDPLTSAWDLGADPVEHARDRARLVDRVRPELESRLIGEGEGYQRLRGATTTLLFERYLSLLASVRTVGGAYVHRDHKADPNGRMPFTPVPAEKQREAARLLLDEFFAEDAFEFEPDLVNKLAPNRWSHWGVGGLAPIDYPVHGQVAAMQGSLLGQLLSPYRIQRMIDNELRVSNRSRAYTAAQLFDDVTRAIWSELGPDGRVRPISSFRRGAQREHVDHLAELLVGPDVPSDEARALARLHLQRIADRIDAVGDAADLDDFTAAHLAETRARIERALKAEIEVETQ